MFSKIRKVLLFLALCLTMSVQAHELSPILEVINRVAPWAKGKVVLAKMEVPEGAADAYELSSRSGKLYIKATSIPAAGMAFNHYLKYFCHQNFTLNGSNLTHVEQLPEIEGVVSHQTQAQYRHLFNFCTQNYSASFYDWDDWERTTDFMVLNGVNLSLATLGLEKVWYNTLKKMGYSKEEILAFLPGPAFNAWHMMGNLEGWGGPITSNMIDRRCQLAKKVIKKMRKMQIEPIYISFYGMVPTTLKEKFPEAHIIEQGNWVGGFVRPSVLSPMDPLYDRMADVFYKELKKLYGEFNYFAGEPFHEGGNRKGLSAADLSSKVLKTIRKHNPGAQWVLQAWSGNPTHDFLAGLSKKGDALIWDFRGELSAEWEGRKGYEGFPFLWGVINNFGETPGLYGRLERFVQEYFRAQRLYPHNMVGLGVSPEGVLNNPVNFELLYEIPWHNSEFSVADWLNDYVSYRYGSDNDKMKQVWQILLRTAYSSNTDSVNIEPQSKALPSIVGNGESIIPAAPHLRVYAASAWGTSFIFYDSEKMKAVVPHLLSASQQLRQVDAFNYDLVDITRQLLSNEFKKIYQQYQQSVEHKDLSAMETCSTAMLEILDDMDRLLSSRKEFMVGAWLQAAKDFGKNDYEKKLSEWNARSQVTYWGKDEASTDLRDYAHKEWAGLIKDVHKVRWQKFFELTRENVMQNTQKSVNPTEWSIAWSRKNNIYPSEPLYDAVEVATPLLKKIYNNEYLR